MSKRRFTDAAEELWEKIPPTTKDRLLRDVFCGECGRCIEIVNYVGEEELGNVLLNGQCSVCGNTVAEVVEIGAPLEMIDESVSRRRPLPALPPDRR